MPNMQAVVDSAKRLNAKDETSLVLLLEMRERAIAKDLPLEDNPDFEPKYDSKLRILNRKWKFAG